MPPLPTFSLIVPTKNRTASLGRLLQSLAATASDLRILEIILVVDENDHTSRAFRFDRLFLRQVVVPSGLTMGALNIAGYEASTGQYLMLLNDDVVARTRYWDRRILSCLQRYPDGIVFIHTNDRLFGEQLCTFPIVSRQYGEIAGGICPRGYRRYRIDDHNEDVFSLLWVLGERRTIYLADVVFEHHAAGTEPGGRGYVPDPADLAHDAPLFQALFAERKELALRLKELIAGRATPALRLRWRHKLEKIDDPFALRVPGRHRTESGAGRFHQRLASGLRRLSAGALPLPKQIDFLIKTFLRTMG